MLDFMEVEKKLHSVEALLKMAKSVNNGSIHFSSPDDAASTVVDMVNEIIAHLKIVKRNLNVPHTEL